MNINLIFLPELLITSNPIPDRPHLHLQAQHNGSQYQYITLSYRDGLNSPTRIHEEIDVQELNQIVKMSLGGDLKTITHKYLSGLSAEEQEVFLREFSYLSDGPIEELLIITLTVTLSFIHLVKCNLPQIISFTTPILNPHLISRSDILLLQPLLMAIVHLERGPIKIMGCLVLSFLNLCDGIFDHHEPIDYHVINSYNTQLILDLVKYITSDDRVRKLEGKITQLTREMMDLKSTLLSRIVTLELTMNPQTHDYT